MDHGVYDLHQLVVVCDLHQLVVVCIDLLTVKSWSCCFSVRLKHIMNLSSFFDRPKISFICILAVEFFLFVTLFAVKHAVRLFFISYHQLILHTDNNKISRSMRMDKISFFIPFVDAC